MSLALIVIIIGLILIFLAAINVPSTKISLGWLGVFLIGVAVFLLK